MTDFITLTTFENSCLTGEPKVLAIAVDRITTVEPAIFEESNDPDHAQTVDGCCIYVDVNTAFYQEINVRDPFDHVMQRLRLAGAHIHE